DPATSTRFVNDLIATFTPAYFERTAGFGVDSERPVFVVGLPRSGTTLTEQVLASHSQVHGAGELGLVESGFESLPRHLGSTGTPFECLSRLDRPTTQALAEQHLRELGTKSPTALRIIDK